MPSVRFSLSSLAFDLWAYKNHFKRDLDLSRPVDIHFIVGSRSQTVSRVVFSTEECSQTNSKEKAVFEENGKKSHEFDKNKEEKRFLEDSKETDKTEKKHDSQNTTEKHFFSSLNGNFKKEFRPAEPLSVEFQVVCDDLLEIVARDSKTQTVKFTAKTAEAASRFGAGGEKKVPVTLGGQLFGDMLIESR